MGNRIMDKQVQRYYNNKWYTNQRKSVVWKCDRKTRVLAAIALHVLAAWYVIVPIPINRQLYGMLNCNVCPQFPCLLGCKMMLTLVYKNMITVSPIQSHTYWMFACNHTYLHAIIQWYYIATCTISKHEWESLSNMQHSYHYITLLVERNIACNLTIIITSGLLGRHSEDPPEV